MDSIDLPSKSYVADVAWIRKGVAKAVPDKVELAEQDLKELLQTSNVKETSDDDSDEGEDKVEKNGLRGSAADLANDLEKYGLDDYDKEDNTLKGPSLKGLAYYASQLDDPYITRHADSEDEEEREDFELKEGDNLVAVAKTVKDEYTIDIYVYNEDNDDWYLHHDYAIEAPPLCLAAFSFDPGAADKKGNLLAVGTMEPVISVWDLDVVNTLEPIFVLGEKAKKSKKSKGAKNRKKRDGTQQVHNDAVLSLDWNQISDHILASGSADNTVILWDLEEAKAAQSLNALGGMVQSLRWHPLESSILLTGTRSGSISVVNCKAPADESPLKWSIGENVEVENVLWNRFQPYSAFVCSNDGKLRYFDTRKPGEFITEIQAHEGGVNSVSQSFQVRNLLATAGDKEVKVWKLENNSQFRVIYERQMNMGNVQVTRFSPDSGCVLAIGADSEDNARILDLASVDAIVTAFNATGEITKKEKVEECEAPADAEMNDEDSAGDDDGMDD